MSADAKTLDETRTVYLVALGVRHNRRDPGTLRREFLELSEAEAEERALEKPEEEHSFRSYGEDRRFRKQMGGSAGTVYKVPQNEEGAIIYTRAEVVGWLQDRDLVTEWSATSRADERASEAFRFASKSDPFQEELEPIREAYRKAVGANKNYLLAAVVRYITG